MSKLIGDKPNQVPTNADLGDLAYQNSQNVVIDTISNEFGVGHIRCVQVTIADDSVAEVIPPKTGGFCFVTFNGQEATPAESFCGMIFYDVGSSLLARDITLAGNLSNDLDVSTSELSGTTGSDGNLTISCRPNVLQLENRSGFDRSIQLTFV